MTRVYDDDLVPAFATRAIHAGQRPEPLAGAIMTPVYLTSTYVQDALGHNKGYEYARGKNPTREALERNVAALEGGRHGFAFSSGMGSVDSIMKLFRAGDHIVCGENLYGGVFRLFDKLLQHFGLSFSWVDTRDPQVIADAMQPNTRLVFVETPSNPLMRLCDLRAAADIAHRHDALLLVDNTFASPFFQRPLELGADIIYHSTTKYLNGHSDMIGGMVVVNDDSLAERLQFILNAAGAVPGPFDSWLALRGTKTLHLRMPRHDANGRQMAGRTPRRGARDLPRSPIAPPARPGQVPDVGLRRHDLGGARNEGEGERSAHPLPLVFPGRVVGRRREPHQPPGVDDACKRGSGTPSPAGHHGGTHPAVLRGRGRGRPSGRSRTRIPRGVTGTAADTFRNPVA